jgi:molybdopterin-guanine dinucleotide biosynthesis protein A
LLNPAVVRLLQQHLDDYDVIVPVDGRFHHPLSAVYRSELLNVIDDLLAAGQRRPVALYERVRTCRVPVETIRSVDPSLDTLWNLNRPADYYQAAQRLGWTVPPEIVKRLTQSTRD